MTADTDRLRHLAALLDDDDVYDLVAGAIADARDRGPRSPGDVDSAEVLDHVIETVRAAASALIP